jgi:hypothetical protein
MQHHVPFLKKLFQLLEPLEPFQFEKPFQLLELFQPLEPFNRSS